MALFDPARPHPMRFPDGRTNPCIANLAAVIDHPNITVGRQTYANDFDPPQDWAARLAPYLYPGAPERLVIGPFCQIAHGARFLTASANHAMSGLSTYPFAIFDPATLASLKGAPGSLPDTVIGADVWIGHGALILPGARIGAGAIIGAGAVVVGEVAPYTIVAGNPARPLRARFPRDIVDGLLALAWWDWPDARIAAALPALTAATPDLTALARHAPP